MMFNSPKNRSSSSVATIGLGGAVLGAALVYWLDPHSGARRRDEVTQKAVRFALKAADAARGYALDFANRSRGLVAQLRSGLADARARIGGATVDDDILVARVRAKLGHVCSHPGTVEVRCRDGRVEVRGTMLRSEVDRVLQEISQVRGVLEIDDDLEVLEAGGVLEPSGATLL